MWKRILFLSWFLLLCGGGIVRAQGERDAAGRAAAAVETLQTWYSEPTGQWSRGIGGVDWWHSANALTALVRYMALTGDAQYEDVIASTFEKNRFNDFLNNFYDDAQWWALAWIDAYDLTGDARYLDAARTVFEDTTGAWDDECGGGVWWTRDRGYKNAITNELFLLLAARLHQRTPDDTEYLAWAQREWAWFQASGMINGQNLVNDGLDDACRNNADVTWTYNQGVILAGLTELFRITGDQALIEQAIAIADAATTRLTTFDGILSEPCEPTNCGLDGPQFKGIFVRHLATLYEETERPAYREFIVRSADALWERARSSDDAIGLMWWREFDVADASRQTSALDALNAAIPFSDDPAAPPYLANLAQRASASSAAFCSSSERASAAIDGDAATGWCTTGEAAITLDLDGNYAISRVLVDGAPSAYALEIGALERGERVWQPLDLAQSPVTNAVRLRVAGAVTIGEIEVYGAASAPPPNAANLALAASARGSAACSPQELPAQAVDGAGDSKWCSGSLANLYMLLDFGEVQTISRAVIRHAGSNGENPGWNTRAYELQASDDGRTDWQTLVAVSDNTEDVTIHDFAPVRTRYLRLVITQSVSAGEQRAAAARIYEFEVYGE